LSLCEEVRHEFKPVWSAIEVLSCGQVSFGTRLIGIGAGFLGAMYDPDIPEFVTARDRVVVDHCNGGCPPSNRIIDEWDELIELMLVYNHGHAVLGVANDDPTALGL
jgi:hypothetical protein